MSSVNARVPPSRLAAIDSPADGEVAAYQASSGQFEWVANGSGGGGSVTSVALTETGTALIITGSPITGAGTFNIAGAGTSSQVILGDLSLGSLPTGTVSSVGTSQAFISITNPTTTPSISIGNASTSATGVLTATDWNTFNNKGSGTVSSVGLTETGSALTITGSPITGSGTLNISGAGTSSQVILGDLSLGTLTSGTITGTGSANQVSYWTAASVQAGSTGLTYNPSTGDLTVGGYVETGTKITTPSGTNLELVPGGASSGSIVIADGANGQISLNPNGTGTVKIDGVEINNSAIATGYVLKATSSTAAGWAAESGGGSGIGGSITDNQVAVGSSTSDEIEGSASYTATLGGSGSVNSLKFGHSDGTTGYTRLRLNGNNAYLEFRDQSDNQKGAIGFQSTQGLKFYAKAGGLGATEALRITPDDEWILNGSNVGTLGQVLTSGGSGAAVSWTTVSGGGGSSYNQARNPNGNIYTGYSTYFLSRGVGFTSIGQLTTTSSTRSGYSRQAFRPFIAPETGNITAFLAVVSTASADTDIEVSIYNDNGGVPDDLIGKATIDCSSTGAKTQTTISATISLTEGTQYWYAWVSTNAIGSPTLRAEAQSQTQFATGQTNTIGGSDYGVILIDIGSTYTTSTSITRTNLVPSGNTGGACRLGVKY